MAAALEGQRSYDFSGRDVAVDVRTIDALHLDQDRALLLQLGGHNQNHRPTVNAGVVARSTAGSSLILGGNAFLDYEVGSGICAARWAPKPSRRRFTLMATSMRRCLAGRPPSAPNGAKNVPLRAGMSA